jgi:oligopeptide/dipeptide ABC transporter ATP-binding protein
MVAAAASVSSGTGAQSPSTLVEVSNLSKRFPTAGGKQIVALDNVSFSIKRGEVLGVVGESGCGKSTLGRTLLRLEEPTQGQIFFDGRDITAMKGQQLKSLRKDAQIVFQDPFGALNPQHKVGKLIGEPLQVHKLGNRKAQALRVLELLDWVDLPADAVSHYCHEFSGGQRQRIAIARALASNPTFLVCDEAVSALDVSIQSQILNLLMDLRQRLDLSMLFISHDLSVIRHICDRVAVMYLGRVVETADTKTIMDNPQHPYTRALLSAIPHPLELQKTRIVLTGEMPDPAYPPSGCNFHTRCQARHEGVDKLCIGTVPELRLHASQSNVACHLCFQ